MAARKVTRILVPLDGSPNSRRGLEAAIGLASQCGAALTGIVSVEAQADSEFGRGGRVSREATREVGRILDESRALAARSGVELKQRSVQGNIGYNIVKAAHSKRDGFDMIVMGSRGRSSVKEMFFGSVSNYVIHASKIPVLLVK